MTTTEYMKKLHKLFKNNVYEYEIYKYPEFLSWFYFISPEYKDCIIPERLNSLFNNYFLENRQKEKFIYEANGIIPDIYLQPLKRILLKYLRQERKGKPINEYKEMTNKIKLIKAI